MAIPTTKDELLIAIQQSYGKLKDDLKDIPEDLVFLTELDGHAKGTKMSVADLVAYLIGWGELVLKWYRLKVQGKPVDFPETGYQWNELGLLAQKFYADYEDLDYQNRLSKLDSVVSDILQLIQKTTGKDLYGGPWYEKYTMGRMIQLNTSSPYKNARSRIRKWNRERQSS